MILKKCKDCKKEKSLIDFYSNNYSKDKLAYQCKECWLAHCKKYRNKNPEKLKKTNETQYLKNREVRIAKQKEWSLNNKDKILAAKQRRIEKNRFYNRRWSIQGHGITVDFFNRMLISQNNSCWVCKKTFKNISEAKIDHCHTSNVVRGLLCNSCNTAIGLVKENLNTLTSIINYLKINKDGWKEFQIS